MTTATLPDGVTDADVERVLKAAHQEADRRTRHMPALRELATDAATDGVCWALRRYSADRGSFEAFALTTVRSFIWKQVSASATKHKNRPVVVELGDELRDILAAPDRSEHYTERDFVLPENVAALPPDLRDAVRLFHIDKYDLRDIGLLMGCTMETARRRLLQAAKALGGELARPERAAGAKRNIR